MPLEQNERERVRAERDARVAARDARHERRLVVVPRQQVQRELVDEGARRLVRVAELRAVDPVFRRDPRVARCGAAEVRLAVVVPAGVDRVERVLLAERRGETQHAGVVLRRRAEAPRELVPHARLVRRTPRHHADRVLRVVQFVAERVEHLVVHHRPAEVDAHLRAIVRGARERGRRAGAGGELGVVQRAQAVVLQVAEHRALRLVRAALRHRADDVRPAARELRVVRVEVHAELAQRLLRHGRPGLRDADEVAVEHALPLDAVEEEVVEPQVGARAGRRQRASVRRRERLDARHDRREVQRVARVERKVLDLRRHHGRRHVGALHLERALRLADDADLAQPHGALLQHEVERRALPDEEPDLALGRRVAERLFRRLVPDATDAHRVRAGRQTEDDVRALGCAAAVLHLAGLAARHGHARALDRHVAVGADRPLEDERGLRGERGRRERHGGGDHAGARERPSRMRVEHRNLRYVGGGWVSQWKALGGSVSGRADTARAARGTPPRRRPSGGAGRPACRSQRPYARGRCRRCGRW